MVNLTPSLAIARSMSQEPGGAESSNTPPDEQHRFLPAPEGGSRATLDVSTGETLKLDELGPLVGTKQCCRTALRLSTP